MSLLTGACILKKTIARKSALPERSALLCAMVFYRLLTGARVLLTKALRARRRSCVHSLEVDTPVMNLIIEHHSAQKRAPAAERALVCNGVL